MKLQQFKLDSISFFKEVIELCKLKTTSERIQFSLLFFTYIGFSTFFVFNTYLLDHPEVNADTFLGFDSQHISRRGFPNITSHPFMAIFSMPPVVIGDVISSVVGLKGKTMFLVFICSYFSVQSQIIVRRYLINIVELDVLSTNIISLFFAFFAYNFAIVMSFDSFAFSFFFLSMATYYFSDQLKRKKNISIASGVLLILTIGGITITNLSKIISVYFFDRIPLKAILKRQIVIMSVFALSLLSLAGSLYFIFNRERIMDLFVRYEYYSRTVFHSPDEIFQTIMSRFFGAPVLLSDYMVIERDLPDGPYILAANYEFYWQYGFVIILLALLLWSIICNYKNRIVLFIVFNFFLDILIHVIFEYGIGEAFIYAGHWLFSFPILLGWLIKSQNKRIGQVVVLAICFLSLATLLNNANAFYELYHNFGLVYFGIN